ncbi:MAG: C4-type zinc ribbon domain-containing protein [Bacteroidota bacterium]
MATKSENIIEQKLEALWTLQQIDSKIDEIRFTRGELPLEVQDLEDEVQGLETRLSKLEEEIQSLDEQVAEKKNAIKESKAAIKKYEGQQSKVRNNREFESLNKEIEFQDLEIQLAEKRIKEFGAMMDAKKVLIEESKEVLKGRSKDLKTKKGELDQIIAETEKEESSMLKKSKAAEKVIDDRLIAAYKRIRSNARNGLAVVSVERDACGGCFNKIPPQRQLDIKSHKKIIVCEHCGRILVDKGEKAPVEEKPKKRTSRKAKAKA